MPLTGTQSQCAFPIGIGHGFQGFLSGADNGGQNHDDQGQATGQNALLQAHHLDEEQHTHQTEDNGGNTGQRFRSKLDHSHHFAASGVFRQINGGAYTQRQHNDHGKKNDI